MTIAEIKSLITAKIAGQGTMVDAGSALPAILNAICDLIDSKAEKLEVDDFEEFDDTTNYDENDIVRHDGKLYQFDVAHDAGPWDDQEVTATNVLTIATAQ